MLSTQMDLIRNQRRVRSTLKGQIEVDGICVEIREFEWDEAGWISADSDHFCVSQLMSPLKGDQKIRWHDARDKRPLTVSQFGVHGPRSPFMIAHGPGSACFLIIQVDVDRFHAMTGSDEWPDDWGVRGLSSESPFFKVVLDRLAGEVLRPHSTSGALVEALVTAFVLELCRVVRRDERPSERTGGLADWQIDRVRSLVSGAGPRIPTVTEIARRCGISVRHLTRGFRAAQGMTLHDYIAEVRLSRAREMLSEGRKPLKVVAAEAGFASPSHFSATFRRAIGCSPSEYRANVRTS